VNQRDPSPAAEPSVELAGNPAQLKAFREGDSDTLSALFISNVPKLRAVLFACGLRGAADVDDAVQTTFVRAFAPAARASYSGLSPFESYLKTIARNVVRDLKKSGRARYEVLNPERADEVASGSAWADPAAAVEAAAERKLRDQFLDRLAPGERQAYEVCFVEGLSERDAAGALSLTRHRVRAAVAAIRRKLARFVKEQGLDD